MQRALVVLTPTDNCDHEQNLIQYESAELFGAEMGLRVSRSVVNRRSCSLGEAGACRVQDLGGEINSLTL